MNKNFKILGLFTALVASSSVFPVIINSDSTICMGSESDKSFCLVASTTTSLPTLIVDDVASDIDSQEIKERIYAELRGDLEPVILQKFADENNLTVNELKALLIK